MRRVHLCFVKFIKWTEIRTINSEDNKSLQFAYFESDIKRETQCTKQREMRNRFIRLTRIV